MSSHDTIDQITGGCLAHVRFKRVLRIRIIAIACLVSNIA